MLIRGRHGVLASVCLLLGACATQKAPPPSTEIDEAAFRDQVRTLASDDFEGRRPGTPAEDKTVAYLVERLRKLGLRPGNGDSFIQTVPMVEVQTAPDAALSVDGGSGTHALTSGKDAVLWTHRALPQAPLRGSEMVFVGFGIVAPEYDWNDYAGIDVHGKTVIILAGDPGTATKDPKLFKGNALTYYGHWSAKIEEAAKQGAAGVLLVYDAAMLGFGWDVVQNTWGGPQLELAEPDGHAGSPAVEGWIQGSAVQALFVQAGLDYAAAGAAAARAGFKPVPMRLNLDATLHTTIRTFNSTNVIALLRGGKRRKETVLYTAHWDGLGRDAARKGHNIFNGAVDDASGVAGLLTLAQSFIRTVPAADRSFVFLATTGGEFGHLGASFYAENPIYPLRETAGVINLDTLLTGGPTRDVSVIGYGNTDLEDMARAAALLQGREAKPDPTPERGFYFWSDSIVFAKHRVPVLYAKRGIDDAARGPVWGLAQIDDYLAHRWRQPTDEYAAGWDVRGTLEDLALYYDVGNRLAQSRRMARWYPNSEYRARRERAASGD